MSPLPNLYPWGTDWIPLPLFEPSLIFFNTPLFTCMTRKTFGKKLLDTSIFVSPPVKNLISQRCHGEIMIYSQLPHLITSMQHHFEAAHRTNHDINW